MGAQWKHAGRTENAAKRGALIGKLIKEVIVAAKLGGADPSSNSRLRAAIETAKKNSVPRDTLERAIKKGSGQLDDGINYELVTYEGFAPHQVPVIVECMTENKNRTASNIRVLFRKGQMSSVGWMFDRMGMVEGSHSTKDLDLEGVAIEAGAQNVEKMESTDTSKIAARFLCDPTDLVSVSNFLTSSGWTLTLSDLGYQAKNEVELDETKKKEVIDFLNDIDDDDDVHRVYTAIK